MTVIYGFGNQIKIVKDIKKINSVNQTTSESLNFNHKYLYSLLFFPGGVHDWR